MRIVITLDIEGVDKDKIAVFAGSKPESPKEDPILLDTVTHIVHNDGERTAEIVRHEVEIVPTPLVGQAAPVDQPVLEAVPAEPAPAPKKRGRKRKTVDIGAAEKAPEPEADIKAGIGTPGVGPEPAPVAAAEPIQQAAIKADISVPQVPICPTCKEPMAADERYDAFLCVKDGQFNNTVKPSQIAAQAALKLSLSKLAPVAPEVKPTAIQAVLTEEEQKSIKARLGKYWVSILPEAGMTADDGKSINAKLTQFANQFAEGREWPNSRAWNAKQWDIFLGFMDSMVGSKGAKALVAHINQEIGSK